MPYRRQNFCFVLSVLLRIHPVKAAAVSQRLRSRAEALFVGEARLGGAATVCDPTKGVFDREFVERIGIVIACPFFEMGMARVSRVGDRLEQFVEAWDAAAILGRSVPFAANI